MKKTTSLSSAFLIILLFKYHLAAQIPTLQWANSFGSSLDLVDGDFVKGMVKDDQGNFFITGMIQGTVDFDPSSAVYNLSSAGSDKDIYTAKYNSNGNLIWAKLITGHPFEDIVRSITIDTSNNVYVAGITNFSNPSCIIRKWDTNGNIVWTKQLAGDMNIKDMIAVNNDLIIAGTFVGTIDFDFSPAIYNLSTKSGLSSDAALFVAKYDLSGNFIFAKKIYTNSANSQNISLPYIPKFGINGGIPSITSDNSGNIYVCDKYSDTASFDLPVTTATLNGGSVFGSKLFIAKYTPGGQLTWVKNITNKLQSTCAIMNTSIKINNNAIYISGSFRADSLDFDPSGATAYLSIHPQITMPDTWNTFMASYDLNGNYKWAKALISPFNNFLGTMKMDSCSNIYISGDFSFNLDFDASSALAVISTNSLSYTNAFLAKYDSSGNYKWAMGILGKGYNGRPEYLEVHGRLSFELDKDNIYFAGTYLDTLDFDPSLNTTYIGSSNHSRDFFAAKYKQSGPLCSNPITTFIPGRNQSLDDSDVYPNPFEDKVIVRSNLEIRAIEINNILGQTVLNSDWQKGNEVFLDLSKLEKGVYFIKIVQANNKVLSRKIIRQ